MIEKHEGTAREFQDRKDRTVDRATWLGLSAVLTLVLGYVMGADDIEQTTCSNFLLKLMPLLIGGRKRHAL